MSNAVFETKIPGAKLAARGKVRDIYDLGDKLLFVATDRVSAFDYVLPNPIPGKGKVLNQISEFWFDFFADDIPNHVIATEVADFPAELREHADQLAGRSMLVRKLDMVQVECVARGYLAGSGWKEYQASGSICGHELPAGLQEGSKLPEPILTPATKAPAGEHDENITIPQLAHIVGAPLASKAGALALALYEHAAAHCAKRGILLADTKFEFGLVEDRLTLIDEIFTPDSSRYWLADSWEPGKRQDPYDKQVIRDALEDTGWDKQPPAPALPDEVMAKALQRYKDIEARITGPETA